MVAFGESTVEEAALDWPVGPGWKRKDGYPPDKQEATQTVLDQAEVLSAEWAVA